MLSSKKSLLIISDSPLFKQQNVLYVFEPTLNEIESVSPLFSKIIWRTYLREGAQGKNFRAPQSPNIEIIPLNFDRGGNTIQKKVRILFSLLRQYFTIREDILRAEVIHTRGPSVPALIVIVHSFFDSKRTYWHKYAGNWSEDDAPPAYRLQRWMLKRLRKDNVRITINGSWPNLHAGFLSMENPCLNDAYYNEIREKGNLRSYSGKLKICFVGTLDDNKGAIRLAKALLHKDFKNTIEGVYFVGDGVMKDELEEITKSTEIPYHLCGALSRERIFQEIYSTCHILILPSMSEGFPKVVAEAAAHFCIPVVTNMSSLDQYIQDNVNGFLLPDSSSESIASVLKDKILTSSLLPTVANEAFGMAEKFTYERFRNRVEQEIINH